MPKYFHFDIPKGLSHKFLGPYEGPFKVLEKKLFDTYKLELSEDLKVHPTSLEGKLPFSTSLCDCFLVAGDIYN